ncbi:hypothetical protein, partial [Klebsiella michiganensis]|uniref:hypothetical protein n=1 Tax=Klebsiella michiganensis TaxID=1134687 RepID=UPI003EBA5485
GFAENTDDLFVGKTLLHGDVLMWLMKTLLTSGCTNQRGAGHNLNRMPWYGLLYRNNFYNVRKHGKAKDYVFYFNYVLKDFCQVLFKAKNKKIKRLCIIIKGFISGIVFNPKIDRP